MIIATQADASGNTVNKHVAAFKASVLYLEGQRTPT